MPGMVVELEADGIKSCPLKGGANHEIIYSSDLSD